jgi:hypothetical protein
VLGLVGLACAWMAGHRRLQDGADAQHCSGPDCRPRAVRLPAGRSG